MNKTNKKSKKKEGLETQIIGLKIRLRRLEDFFRDMPNAENYLLDTENYDNSDEQDEFFEKGVRVVSEYNRASASLIQRRLSIGYARAARLLDQLEKAGIVTAPEGSKPRDVIIDKAKDYLKNLDKITKPQTVKLQSLLSKFKKSDLNYKLPIYLGIDNKGKKHYTDLCELEHILIAGATGSGKSIFNHTLIYTLVQKYKPSELQFFLADPKRVELTVYNGFSYLTSNVVVEPAVCLDRLSKIINKKDNILKKLTNTNFNNIEEYNKRFKDKKIPYLVIIIDTFSDVCFYDPERFQSIILNLTHNAISAGIHLVMCDSRPSPDLYTDTIKHCFPTKIAFNLVSKVDSHVIIGQSGAEKLRGMGDMLFLPKGKLIPTRLQAPNISEKEIHTLLKIR